MNTSQRIGCKEVHVRLARPSRVSFAVSDRHVLCYMGGLSIPVHASQVISQPLLCQDPPPQPTEATAIYAEAKALAIEAPSSMQLS